jgi:hypothetical protein
MGKCKCLCCENEMSRYKFEEYEQMTVEERDMVINEHKDQCEWVNCFKDYFDEEKKNSVVYQYGCFEALRSFKIEAIIDILIEKGIADKKDIESRMIKKAGRAIDLESRDAMIQYLKENLNNE